MELIEKLMHIQAELKAPKDKYNSFGKYKFRSCESILEAVKPLLAKYKCVLLLDDHLEEVAGRVYIKANATLIDAEKDSKSDMVTIGTSAYAREPENKTGMDQAQLTGACSSYARKYALNGLFAIDDSKDADTNEYHEESKGKKKAATGKDVSFGTASGAEQKQTGEHQPFDVGESAELQGLRALMERDSITEDQVLDAFKGKFSAIENIDNASIMGLLNKWEKFVTYIKGGNEK